MAKENTVKGASSKKKPEKVEPTGFKAKVSAFMEFLRSERGRKTMALLLILSSIFLLVACISHFFTGYRDQSVIEAGGPLGNPAEETPSNWLGSVGAFFAHIFVSKGFGIMALLIPIYTGFWGFSMLENRFYPITWKFLKYLLFGILWGSPMFAWFSIVLTGRVGDLAGGFGWFLNEKLFNYIGMIGMGLVLLISLLIFLVVNFNAEFPVSKWMSNLFTNPDKEGISEEAKETLVGEGALGTANQTDEEEEEEEEGPIGEMELVSGDKGFLDSVIPPVEGKESDLAFGNEVDLSEEVDEKSDHFEKAPDQNSLELEIAENEEKSIDSLVPEGEDNIIEVEEGKFEKYIPDEDLDVLDDEEILADWEEYDPTKDLSDYKYPTLDLLNIHDSQDSREVNRAELEENKNKIVRTLNNYKIEIVSIKATIGPTVTLYEIVPAPGVRISKIKNLEDDIALSLAALGIRIIAPIPGRGTIGIEIPNSNPEIVSMRSVLGTEKFRDTKAELPIAIGKTISNEVYIADLAKMPHLLIAGATGQGKSVGINGLISSIIYKKHPSQVKFVLIDPKKVELSLYAALEKHFIAKLDSMEDCIITDTKQVIYVLNSLCIEMDSRYDLLKKAKVRNLREYNEKFTNRKLNPKKGHRFMPYIVLIIDEFADLMMTAGKEIETPIARLAQLARAIGIHLVLATQRPSVNVITGIIKANFPARVSFRVTSKVDSRTILDTGGADQLVGRGDLLFSTGSDIIRIQNPFIDTPEVEKLVDFIASQRGYSTPWLLPEVPMDSDMDDDDNIGDLGEKDEMFAEAARLIVRHQQGSTSLIQRRLKLGYNRAGRIIDQLEHAGIVGPFSGSKAREVLVRDETELEQILSGLN